MSDASNGQVLDASIVITTYRRIDMLGELLEALLPQLKDRAAEIVIVERRFGNICEEDAMNVGEKEIANVAEHADFILQMQRSIKHVGTTAAPYPSLRDFELI